MSMSLTTTAADATTNDNRIYMASYGRNFRGAGGRWISVQCNRE